MADAVIWRLMETVQARLRDKLEFSAAGDDPARRINETAIQIVSLDPDEQEQGKEAAYSQIRLPGILITPPSTIERPPGDGENSVDRSIYRILIQIVDAADYRSRCLRTYLKWQEQIVKYCSATDFAQQVFDVNGYVYFCHAVAVQVVDKRLFVGHRLFRAGVVVECLSDEPRGVS